jgi:hypothetical protein
MSGLVAAGDHRALLLYLLLLTKASAPPWNAALPSAVWARALGINQPMSKTATSIVSKAWLRLERRQLISRIRRQRMADITLLCEDGSGLPYTSPGSVKNSYLRVPMALWTSGNEEGHRWYRVLSLPELAVLLIARSLGDEFRLPYQESPRWYGISADSAARGLNGLRSHGLLVMTKTFKKAPLSPVGYTAEHRYTLQVPFGPIGRKSRAVLLDGSGDEQ